MKFFKIICFSVITFIVSIMFLLFVPFLYNNILLKQYSNQLFDIPIPIESELLSQKNAVGNLYGTGNHLDFWAIIEIKSDLTEEDLINYYKKYTDGVKTIGYLSPLKKDKIDYNSEISVNIEVIPKKQAKLKSYSTCIVYKSDDIDKTADEKHFIIQIKDTHYKPGLDLRAH